MPALCGTRVLLSKKEIDRELRPEAVDITYVSVAYGGNGRNAK